MVISRLRQATDLGNGYVNSAPSTGGYARISLEPQRDLPCWVQVSGGARFEVGKASRLSWICLLVLREMWEGIPFGRNSEEPMRHNETYCVVAVLNCSSVIEWNMLSRLFPVAIGHTIHPCLVLIILFTFSLSELHEASSIHPCQSAAPASQCPVPLARSALVSHESVPVTQQSVQSKLVSTNVHHVGIGQEALVG